MVHELGLTPEQDAKVRELFDRRRKDFDRVLDEVRPRMDALKAEADKELATILTPEQFERFQAKRREMEPPRRQLVG
jgi:Spy/CpxP family protein refolding chaperone